MIETTYSLAIRNILSQDIIGNQNILGIMENEKDVKIYVDDIKNPTGVIAINGYFNFIYTKESSFIKKAKKELFQRGEFGFSGLRDDIAEEMKKDSRLDWENKCYLLYLPLENIKLDTIENNVISIKIEDAEIVDKFYTYRSEKSIEYIKKSIMNRPSSAIYKDGELLSWVLTHNENSMGIMYTKKEHRKKGYAYDLTVDLASKIIMLGKIPFVHITIDNYPSLNLAKKCGFKIHGKVSWLGVKR